ncbi:4Fe-4S ferredoxin, partial [Symplocastrum sp. BBK-W-15]|nr:4Fe-4S ferredoxin [Limnofasciculus baicalensis BBK-W-15]
MTQSYDPLHSLREGHWFKLICGASFQHLPAVRNLTLAYTLAGADCIDVAADPAVVEAAREALNVAANLKEAAQTQGFQFSHRPWLMVSINDGEDPHFRKAEFDPDFCPADCPRPCEKICPAQAIVFYNTTGGE